ncbi:MAG: hypothetical protein ICV79_20140 [Flavisolibacter sp.]|nr:hypothetical protein [Flavisolibacter sp.]
MMNLPDAPYLLRDVWYGLLGAFIEWTESNCNELADVDNVKGITKRINGGMIGGKKGVAVGMEICVKR